MGGRFVAHGVPGRGGDRARGSDVFFADQVLAGGALPAEAPGGWQRLGDLAVATRTPAADQAPPGLPPDLSVAFRSADRTAAPPSPGHRGARATAVSARLTALVAGAIALPLGGLAAAAYTTSLPASVQRVAHHLIGAPAPAPPGHRTGPGGAPAPSRSTAGAGPSSPGASSPASGSAAPGSGGSVGEPSLQPSAVRTLCTSFVTGTLLPASEGERALAQLAGGTVGIGAFCAQLGITGPSAGAPSAPLGGTTPSPAQTAAPTGTLRPTATPRPTTTPRLTATPQPTATSQPTATQRPSATPSASATPSPSASSTATPSAGASTKAATAPVPPATPGTGTGTGTGKPTKTARPPKPRPKPTKKVTHATPVTPLAPTPRLPSGPRGEAAGSGAETPSEGTATPSGSTRI